MIFITGDTHRAHDLDKLKTEKFPQGQSLTSSDYVIICGDFGAVWDNSYKDTKVRNWYNSQPWTTLFVDGNHENFDLLKKYPIKQWHGGKVQFITPKIIHLMRGQIYEIEGHTFFTMGGAVSVDRYLREPHKTWWADELPSNSEYDEGLDNLEKVGNKVDYILTHCAPYSLQELLFCYYNEKNVITSYFEIIRQTVEFKDWYFGHYHLDKDMGKFHARYQVVSRLDENE